MPRFPDRTFVRSWLCAMALVVSARAAAAGPQPAPFVWRIPEGFPPPNVPADNPMSEEKVLLGRFLFYDKRLSGNETQACASCHQQEHAFTDGRSQALGSTGEAHPRGAMSVANAAYAPTLGWANPILTSLEQQALVPMFGETPVELGLAGKEMELLARFRADGRYQRLFREAFPDEADPLSIANITRAISAFERTIITGNSALDRYFYQGEELSDSAERGLELFFFSERFECFHCHGGFNLTASQTFEGEFEPEISFQNTGLYNIDGSGGYPRPNTGIHEISGIPEDMGRFKPPTLRNIELTAPYMHDGSLATLGDVLNHYAAGGRTIEDGPHAGIGRDNPFKSQFVRGFQMTDREKDDLLNFLKSLTDWEFVSDRRLSDPFAQTGCAGDCALDGTVTINELITNVGVGLGDRTLANCLAGDVDGDGEIGVSELIRAVNAALGGCSTP